MKQYKLVNNIVGWAAFLVAAVSYCLTVEPTASFWDCPEFITTAYKLEVGHPPGAPFFMLTGNFFSLFASDPSQVAYMVNTMNALLSAFCILFLFWTITHLTRKLLCADGEPIAPARTILIMGCGLTGALAYAWSDTFWFSAVEGEVYSYSSCFTALVFWLILKWEDNADSPRADRFLVLIFYLTGLSIGVHLLNLLCLPAIVLVYYYKKHPEGGVKGSLGALAVSAVLVAAVLYGVVPGIVKVGGWFELFFVNTVGLPFQAGLIIYIVVLVAVVLGAIYLTNRPERRAAANLLFALGVALLGIPFYGSGAASIIFGLIVLAVILFFLFRRENGLFLVRPRLMNTALLCMLMLMIGYSTYALIVIRSTQNTPMDQNSPEDIFTLGTYLNREQYGSRPLFYGEAFTSQPTDFTMKENVQRHEKTSDDEPDSYDVVEVRDSYIYPSEMQMIFPRIYSSAHADKYRDWIGDMKLKRVRFTAKDRNGKVLGTDYGQMPSQADNLRFLFSYQINFMYWRYFLWNFAGRQNDIQGHGELEHGNWITGIPFLDEARLGRQSKLPTELRENKGHNVFYCLPLLLGLLGLFWQCYQKRRGAQQFWVVFFLFFMTGLAIVLYLNQTPNQPRERDYAYAGSFYAFAIWIGLGVAALASGVKALLTRTIKGSDGKHNETAIAAVVSIVCLAVPLQMVSQTWDDHDRSGRYACRDFGANYLFSLDENGYPVIYTNGDNDTFPLWYNQDTEGVRTDARVCNLSYLQTDWYTDQMRRPAYDSPPLPITWQRYEYVDNMGHDIFYVRDNKAELESIKSRLNGQDPFELSFVIDNFVRNDQIGYVPTDSLVLHIDKDAVRRSGMMLPYGSDSIPDYMVIRLSGKRYITRSEMMIYEMLAHANWERPLYMSVTLGEDNMAGLKDYLVLEGLAYRITPFALGGEAIDSEKMYNNMMNKFAYGNVASKDVYLDETVRRMCYTHRSMFVLLCKQLLSEAEALETQAVLATDSTTAAEYTAQAADKREKALKAVTRCEEMLPSTTVDYNYLSLGYDYETGLFGLPTIWHKVERDDESERVCLTVVRNYKEYLDWLNTLSEEQLRSCISQCRRCYMFFSAATDGLEACGSDEFKTYNDYREHLANTPVGRLLINLMYQQ